MAAVARACRFFLLLLLVSSTIDGFHIGDLDHPLSINRPDLVTLGSEVTFSCVLARSDEIEGDSCELTTPSGAKLSVDVVGGVVTELGGGGGEVEGVTGIVDEEKRTCGLIIEQVDQQQIGEWTCQMYVRLCIRT